MTPQKPACQPVMGLPALPTGIRCRTEWRSPVALPLAPPPQCCVGYMCAEVTWGTASHCVSLWRGKGLQYCSYSLHI